MKKYFRILLNLALVFLLIFSSNAVYAVNTNNGTDLQLIRKDIEQQVRSQYMNDPQFIMDVQENGPSHGEEMLNRIIDSKLRKLLDSSSGIGIQSGNGSVFFMYPI